MVTDVYLIHSAADAQLAKTVVKSLNSSAKKTLTRKQKNLVIKTASDVTTKDDSAWHYHVVSAMMASAWYAAWKYHIVTPHFHNFTTP